MKKRFPSTSSWPDSGQYVLSCFLLACPRLWVGLWLMGVTSVSWGQCFQRVPNPAVSATAVVGRDPQAAAIADFNGDGKPDLVTINEVNNTVSVLLGNGYGGFGIPTRFGVGKQPYSVTTGDINADGSVDVMTANYGANTVSLLLNDGNGGFSPAVSVGVGTAPASVVATDVNGDGKLDLVTANQGDNTVSLLVGDGRGSFAKPVRFGTGGRDNQTPQCIRVGDFNGDGKLDLVVLNDDVYLLINQGNGTFGPATVFDALIFARSLEVGDVNGDGKLDVITAGDGDGRVTVLLNDAHGGFITSSVNDLDRSPYYVALSDVNGDGNLDLAVNGDKAVAVLLGKGDGRFGDPIKFDVDAGIYVRTILASDVNRDGKPDLVVSVFDQVAVLLSCTVPPTPSTNVSQTAIVGIPFAYTVTAFTAGAPATPLTYSASITPPNGLSFDPTTRLISGTPTLVGVSSVRLVATDLVGLSAATSVTITVINPPILGIDEPGTEGLVVSPNPSSDDLRVWLSSVYRGSVTLTLYTARGEVIKTYSTDKTGTLWQHRLLVPPMPPGVYYLKVQQGEQQTIKKVVRL